jgi:hypothetical protein
MGIEQSQFDLNISLLVLEEVKGCNRFAVSPFIEPAFLITNLQYGCKSVMIVVYSSYD